MANSESSKPFWPIFAFTWGLIFLVLAFFMSPGPMFFFSAISFIVAVAAGVPYRHTAVGRGVVILGSLILLGYLAWWLYEDVEQPLPDDPGIPASLEGRG
jgi:hypothetical protein